MEGKGILGVTQEHQMVVNQLINQKTSITLLLSLLSVR